MYATDRQTSDRCQIKASLNASALCGGGIIISVQHITRLNRIGRSYIYSVHVFCIGEWRTFLSPDEIPTTSPCVAVTRWFPSTQLLYSEPG